MVQLGANQYGKAEVRLVHVARGAGPGRRGPAPGLEHLHVPVRRPGGRAPDRVQREGAAHRLAEEQGVRPGQGARRRRGTGDVRDRARLVLRVVPGADHPGAGRGRGVRLDADRREAGTRSRAPATWCGPRWCTWTLPPGVSVVSGLKDLTVMNTTASEFWGYPKDAYTTLPETKDRILATSVQRLVAVPAVRGRRRDRLGRGVLRWPGRRSWRRSPAPIPTRCSRCCTRSAPA